MSFGPKPTEQARECPSCHRAVPLPRVARCPTCGAKLQGPADPGAALVDAMKDVLGGPAGRRGEHNR